MSIQKIQKQYAPLVGYAEESAPDVGLYDLERERLIIHPDAVVVRAKNGDIVSRFKDDIWEIIHYGGPSNLHFKQFNQDKEDVKKLIYAVLINGGSKDGKVTGSQLSAHYFIIKRIYNIAHRASQKLRNVLRDKDLLMEFCESELNSNAGQTLNFFINIEQVGIDIGIDVPGDLDRTRLLKEKSMISIYNVKQTPLTPLEIYSEAFRQRWMHFERIENMIDEIAAFISRYVMDPNFGRSHNKKYQSLCTKLIPFKDAVNEYGLFDLFKYYEVISQQVMMGFINSIQITCAHLIGATTGMRVDELKLLRQGCFKEASIKRPATITGWEKKGNRGVPRHQDWITSPDIERVARVLEKIGSALTEGMILSEPNEMPLFVTSYAIRQGYRQGQIVYNKTIIPKLIVDRELPLDQDKLILTQPMMDNFLKVTHLPGRWEEEDEIFKVGKPWKFNWHQHRRMFAFLSVNSGLVPIPALQRQLAHSLQSVSAYYAGGALNLEPLITDGINHITKEIIKERDLQAAIALTYYISKNKARTNAAMDAWAKKMTEKDITIEEKVVTIKQLTKEVHKGNYHIKGTPVGSCIKPDACDSYLTFSFMDCGDCEHSIKDVSRINNSIATTEQSIEKLNNMGYKEESYEMEAQKKELEYFKQQLIKAQKEESDELR